MSTIKLFENKKVRSHGSTGSTTGREEGEVV